MPFDIGDHVRINEDGIRETSPALRERLAVKNELVIRFKEGVERTEYYFYHVDTPEAAWPYYYYESEIELIDSRYPPNVVRMPTRKKADV